MAPPPHEQEVRAAVAGDPAALESVFERSVTPLVAFIRARLGPALAARESATDLAQSVYREVIQDFSALEYRGEDAFRGWLFKHAVRKILDRNRYHHRERRDIQREVNPGADAELDSLAGCYATLGTPTRHAAAREELARVEAAVAGLPENQRDAVSMSRLLGLSYAEIAELMDCSESAVRGLVARGLAALAAQLGPG
jgi:RNA polymerase sigma-70 factor (ECF subfamily)